MCRKESWGENGYYKREKKRKWSVRRVMAQSHAEGKIEHGRVVYLLFEGEGGGFSRGRVTEVIYREATG